MHWPIILVFATYIITVHSQTWNGTFLISSTCSPNVCICCLTNKIIITYAQANQLNFTTSLTGSCLDHTTYSGLFNNPNGYTATATFMIATLTIKLSNDSNTLSISSSMGSSCGLQATRQDSSVETTTTRGNTAGQYVDIFMLSCIVVLCYIISIVLP